METLDTNCLKNELPEAEPTCLLGTPPSGSLRVRFPSGNDNLGYRRYRRVTGSRLARRFDEL